MSLFNDKALEIHNNFSKTDGLMCAMNLIANKRLQDDELDYFTVDENLMFEFIVLHQRNIKLMEFIGHFKEANVLKQMLKRIEIIFHESDPARSNK